MKAVVHLIPRPAGKPPLATAALLERLKGAPHGKPAPLPR